MSPRAALPVTTVLVLVAVAALAALLLGRTMGDRSSPPSVHAPQPPAVSAFAERLSATMARLDAARTAGEDRLRTARHATTQAAAARALARAHQAAAQSLAPLASTTRQTAIVHRLAASAAAYRDLAGAADARLPTRYIAASRGVERADGALRQAVASATAARPARATARPPAPPRHPSPTSPSVLVFALLGLCALFLAMRETLGALER